MRRLFSPHSRSLRRTFLDVARRYQPSLEAGGQFFRASIDTEYRAARGLAVSMGLIGLWSLYVYGQSVLVPESDISPSTAAIAFAALTMAGSLTRRCQCLRIVAPLVLEKHQQLGSEAFRRHIAAASRQP